MNANSSNSTCKAGIRKWFAFDKAGIAIIVVAALALAVYGFFDPEMMAGGPETEEPAAEAVHQAAAQTGSQAAASGLVVNPRLAVGAEDDPADPGVLAGRSANRQGGRNRTVDGQSPNPSIRSMDMRTLYFGEDDWNFIGVITMRFILNMVFAYILICVIFTREHRIREYSFSYFVSNILIFMVTSLLASVRVRQGFAFGLFAILSILRFRTEQLQVREMTFLFASLILGVINSLATDGLSIFAILWANVVLCMFVYICDQFFIGQTNMINLVYDNTRLLAKDKTKELHEDIKNRFGYDVVNVSVVEMSYLTDSAKIKLIYRLRPDAKQG